MVMKICISDRVIISSGIYESKLTTIGSDNGLSPGQPQAIIWTNAGILLIGHLGQIAVKI